mgnify:CR=1 FL=1
MKNLKELLKEVENLEIEQEVKENRQHAMFYDSSGTAHIKHRDNTLSIYSNGEINIKMSNNESIQRKTGRTNLVKQFKDYDITTDKELNKFLSGENVEVVSYPWWGLRIEKDSEKEELPWIGDSFKLSEVIEEISNNKHELDETLMNHKLDKQFKKLEDYVRGNDISDYKLLYYAQVIKDIIENTEFEKEDIVKLGDNLLDDSENFNLHSIAELFANTLFDNVETHMMIEINDYLSGTSSSLDNLKD